MATRNIETPEGIKPGDTFGLLTVVEFAGRNARYQAMFNVKCSCGSVTTVLGTNIKKGNTTRCNSGAHRAVHGLTGTAEYVAWRAMMWRVNAKHPAVAPYYRDRGIVVCDKWRASFVEFLRDMGPMPKAGMEVDRNHSDGNYEPSNCKWSSRKDQMRNTPSNNNVTINGRTQCLSAWAEESGISAVTLSFRVKRGWPENLLLSKPDKKRKRLS